MPFPSRREYEDLIYQLSADFPNEIASSTLRLYSMSSLTAKLEGDVQLVNGLLLRVLEFIDFRRQRILDYSYTVFSQSEKIRWYDPQPHPEFESLKPTFPHHRHEPPDIKQNRQPAPGISFDAPNVHTLIQDCIALGESLV